MPRALPVPVFAALLLANCVGPASLEGPDGGLSTTPPASPGDAGPVATGSLDAGGGTDAGSARVSPFYFGTLASEPDHAEDESNGGVKIAMLEVEWRFYEPQPGQFDAQYIAAVKANLARFKAAGRQVTLSLSVHSTPAWAFTLPNSRFVAEDGTVFNDDLNVVFNQKLRDRVAAFYARFAQDIGLQNFWAIRLHALGNGEVLYPSDEHYWAFDANAKNGPDLPVSIARNPSPNGPNTRAEITAWVNWYIAALADVVSWQINLFNAQGFRGYYEILTPGVGVRPSEYEAAINDELPLPSLVAAGAVWHRIYAALPRSPRIAVHITSVADGSFDDGDCQPGDAQVPLTDSAALNWSATRWLSRIATENGFDRHGENPGLGVPPETDSHYLDRTEKGMMAGAFRLIRSCHLRAFYWAHSFNFWNGTAPFSEFRERITAANGPVSFPPPLP